MSKVSDQGVWKVAAAVIVPLVTIIMGVQIAIVPVILLVVVLEAVIQARSNQIYSVYFIWVICSTIGYIIYILHIPLFLFCLQTAYLLSNLTPAPGFGLGFGSGLTSVPENVGLTGETSYDLHSHNAVTQAHEIFKRLFPQCEFFPPREREQVKFRVNWWILGSKDPCGDWYGWINRSTDNSFI